MENNGVLAIYISHTDLDGYTSQYLADLLESERVIRSGLCIEGKRYFNLDYSEISSFVSSELPEILEDVEYKHIHIYVTDLNLNTNLSQMMDDLVEELRDKWHEVSLYLYDHHITGQEAAKQYSWYHLDATKSASKLVYDLLMEETGGVGSKYDYTKLSNLIDLVNATDIFKVKETVNFGAGRALTRLMTEVDEIIQSLCIMDYRPLFYDLLYSHILGRTLDDEPTLGEELNINLVGLDLFKQKINLKSKIGLEDLVRPLTKSVLGLLTFEKINILNDAMKESLTPERIEDMTLAEIRNLAMSCRVLYDDDFPSNIVEIDMGDGRVVKWLIFNSKGMNISDIAREVLLVDTSLDFVLGYQTIGEEVICSLRSLNKDDIDNLGIDKPMFNVSTIAKSLGGGGHVNASGFQVTDDSEIINKVTEALKGVMQ